MKFAIFLGILFLLSCAGTNEVVQDATPEKDTFKYDESFDPLTLNDDDIIIAGEEFNRENNNSLSDSNTENLPSLHEITGFRVQILATKNIETASLFEQEATERFKNLDQKTYLIFEAPLYKIRVGDCKDRLQAEDLRDMAMQYGYREAFIVKTKIQITD